MYYLIHTIKHTEGIQNKDSREFLASTVYDQYFNAVAGIEIPETTQMLKNQGNFNTIYHRDLSIYCSETCDRYR